MTGTKLYDYLDKKTWKLKFKVKKQANINAPKRLVLSL